MNKPVIAISAIAFVMLTTSSNASNPPSPQTRCALTESTAPSVRGLSLGMSVQQLLALFPGVAKRKEMKEAVEKAKSATSAEVTSLGINASSDGDSKQFAGVESVSATVAKGRVVDFSIQYIGATWSNIDEWLARVSETLNLPGKDGWATGSREHPNRVLRCDGIEIEVGIQGGGSSIRVTNTSYFKAIEEQGKAAEEKKRRDAKP